MPGFDRHALAPPFAALLTMGVLAGCSSGPPPPVTFTLTELAPPDGGESYACAINDKGQAVGYATVKAASDASLPPGIRTDVHTVEWNGAILVDLGPMGGAPGCSQGINEAGLVAGYSLITGTSEVHATLWKGSMPTDLGTVAGGQSSAVGINANGQVAGNSTFGSTSLQHAALWADGVAADLGTLGGDSSSAAAINDDGWVVGYAETAGGSKTHAVLWKDREPADLGTLSGGDYSFAMAINKGGVVAGYAVLAGNGGTHAALWSGGEITDLGTLGGQFSMALGLNDAGLVVGNSALKGGATHAALWIGSAAYDLNDMLDASGRGWTLAEARDVNAAGQIVGWGDSPSGNKRGFLLTPVKPIAIPEKKP